MHASLPFGLCKKTGRKLLWYLGLFLLGFLAVAALQTAGVDLGSIGGVPG